MEEPRTPDHRLTRRQVVSIAGATGAAFVIGRTAAATGTRQIGPATEAACGNDTPAGEMGPFFADDTAKGFHRTNIVANIDGTHPQPGVPLSLTLYVFDAGDGCKPMPGVRIDIWHCNAEGVYSDVSQESTESQTYLRGYQLTDARGKAVFKTIMPGWYQGRTAHVHLRLQSKYSDGSAQREDADTTQLFFPQTLINHLYGRVAPYNARGSEDTTNATDHVYTDQTKGQTLLSLTGDEKDGYSATFSIFLPIE